MNRGLLRNPPRGSGGRRRTGAYAVWGIAGLLVLLALAAPAAFVDAKGTRPNSVTFKYHAFGGPSPASITLTENDQTLSTSTVVDGGTFTITAAGGDDLGTTTGFIIGGKDIQVHTSCSAPIAIGYIFNDDIEKPAPDAQSINGYSGPTAVELVNMLPQNACGNTATPPPSQTPTPTPTPTPTCPGGATMPPSGVCPTPTPTPTCPGGGTMPPSGTCPTPTPPPDLRCPIGTTKFVVRGTNDASYTDFTFTVTVEYTNNRYLDFKSNLGVRELILLGSGGTSRYQFNPAIRQGSRFTAAGTHTIQTSVFCYVKPSATPTPPPCNCATPTPTPPPCNCETPKPTPPPCDCAPVGSTLVNDPFRREVSGSWGSAPQGGKYTHDGSGFRVDYNSGALTVNKGSARSALLNGVSARDVDIKFRVRANKVGGAYYVYAVARKNGNNEYRPRLIFNANGTVSVQASIVVNGRESALGSPVVVPGLNQSASSFIWFRAQVVGANPTTIKVKAWKAGTAEPSSWQWVKTHNGSVCQSAGSLGLRAYVSSSSNQSPVTFRFDDYRVLSL